MRQTAALLVSFLILGHMQDEPGRGSYAPGPKPQPTPGVVVKADGRGRPHLNLTDGYDLGVTAAGGGTQPVALGEADFDSDGRPDLIVADQSGMLNLYRGDEPQNKPEPAAGHARAVEAVPFASAASTPAALNFTPDYLAVGDFNADGFTDILASARGTNVLSLLAGDGRGHFAPPLEVELPGQVTALAAGEVGYADGQADVAVAVASRSGAQLLVFEHPEGAFRHAPEVYSLPAPATALAFGQFDEDAYGDLAVAGGEQLTVVHGRGQAYPWDLDQRYGVVRPRAVVARKRLPFAVAAMAVGDFVGSRGDDLALLSEAGSVFLIEPARDGKTLKSSLPVEELRRDGSISQSPAGARYALLSSPQSSGERARRAGLAPVDLNSTPGERLDARRKEARSKAERAEGQGGEGRDASGARLNGGGERAKAAFLKSISARPSTLASWRVSPLFEDPRLTAAASSPAAQKLVRARISDSGKDDLVILDPDERQLHVITRAAGGDATRRAELVTLDVESVPTAVMPARLNADAFSDLVILRRGAASPSVVMSAAAQTFTVNTTSDGVSDCLTSGQPCTLRQAIQLANSNPGADTIAFSILGCGPHKIQPLSGLPAITQAVTIQGSTQPCYSGTPRVEIDGSLIAQAADGLKIRASNCVVQGLAVNGFPTAVDPDTGSQVGGNGITLETPEGSTRNTNNTVWFNYLGVAPDGTTDKGNAAAGLNVFDSDSNVIQGNTISGNAGAGVAVTNGNNNFIVGNRIGTNAAGTAKLPNDRWGLLLSGKNNKVGGDGASDGNTISGNGKGQPDGPGFTLCRDPGVGVFALVSLTTGEQLTSGNTLKGNRIGTDPSGTQPLGNCSTGVVVAPVTATTIGSITGAGRNVISDNGYDAVHCDTSYDPGGYTGGFCAISGNNVGTDVTGTAALGNDWRGVKGGPSYGSSTVFVFNNETLSNVGAPGGTTPGGDCTGFCNLVSGNGGLADGAVGRVGYGTVGIFNNYVGTNKGGTAALPNALNGIYAANNDTFIGGYDAAHNTGLGNLVSGNSSGGILVTQGLTFFAATFDIEANLVGTDAAGAAAIPNGDGSDFGAVSVYAYPNMLVEVGGANPFSKNYISGNDTNGVRVAGLGGHAEIVNNHVGLSKFNQPLGNSRHGVLLTGEGTTVGGAGPGAGNVIYNNTLAGVAVETLVSGNSLDALKNTVRGNSIRDNGGLGIDLTLDSSPDGDGVTPNDCTDEDEGPNRRQNFPELFDPTFNPDGTVTVTGFLKTQPSAGSYTIDFYANTDADPSQYGEGEAYLGSKTVQPNGNGFATFEFTSAAPVSNDKKITATATDPDGNTSEFSCYAGGCGGGSAGPAKAARLAAAEIKCTKEIFVNITTDEPDADGDQPNPNLRDGHCDAYTDAAHPGDQCSLRAAIQEANPRPEVVFIRFALPGGEQVIAPGAALPNITGRVSILGLSEGGVTRSIIIDGANAGADASGLKLVNVSSSEVSGLVIRHFARHGILISGGSANVVKYCTLGDESGAGQMESGVTLENSSQNRIGGEEPINNTFLYNKNNLVLRDSNDNAYINGNLITGGLNGIVLIRSSNNQIGNENFQNSIGDVAFNAIYISDAEPPSEANFRSFFRQTSGRLETNPTAFEQRLGRLAERLAKQGGGQSEARQFADRPYSLAPAAPEQSHDNIVLGNSIGTSSQLTLNGNGRGVFIGNALRTFVGSFVVDRRNRIAKSTTEGIYLDAGAQQTSILNNYIGTNSEGTAQEPNTDGIAVLGSASQLSGNLISGNTRYGVLIGAPGGSPATGNKLFSNLIGTDRAGLAPLGNEVGIQINSAENTVGGSAENANTIGGNRSDGIRLQAGASDNTVADNLVGIASDGTALANGNGIFLLGNRNQILRNVVSGNRLVGIWIECEAGCPAPQENLLQQNLVGTNKTGEAAVRNSAGVVLTKGAWGNKLTGNTISGNELMGVRLGALGDGDAEAHENDLQANYIGTNSAGTTALPNTDGVVINEGATQNYIGGSPADPFSTGNLISGNRESGVLITKLLSESRQPTDNVVRRNRIGLGQQRSTPISNLTGVLLGNGAKRNVVGGSFDADGNVIAGNVGDGVLIYARPGQLPPTENKVQGNLIGLERNDIPGADENVGNLKTGIQIRNAAQNLIGGTDALADLGNVVGNNQEHGILLQDDFPNTHPNSRVTRLNQIVNNYVGVTASISGRPNRQDGIHVLDAVYSRITENTVAGNAGQGIYLETDTGSVLPTQNYFTVISGNRVGAYRSGLDGNIKVGNGLNGIFIQTTTYTLIGKENPDSASERPNVIVGNGESGVSIQNGSRNFIVANFIGTDENKTPNLGNSGDGIYLFDGTSQTTAGGATGLKTGNTIANNGGSGVNVAPDAGAGNNIDPNSIYGNAGQGIDLGAQGATPNDPGDADSGPNNLQNFPEFVSAVIDAGGQLILKYKVDSAPANTDYGASGLRVEFFKADSASSLEGQSFIGSDGYTQADYNDGTPGTKTLNLGAASALGVAPGDRLVATATDASGNTSEFTSAHVGVVTDGSTPPTGAGTLIISEFRLRGPAGSSDEFVELYNNTDAPVTVGAADGSGGWALAALGADGSTVTTLLTLPDGTNIPARAHYLAVNMAGYSLSAYAAGDKSFSGDLPDDAGLALFDTANPASFDAAHRLDAVGFNSLTGASAGLYREGAGLTPFGPANAEYGYLRKLSSGTPQDTGDNASDFVVVSTQAETYGGGLRATLGAPGPENSTSPVQRNAEFTAALLDTTASQDAPPNRVRTFDSEPSNNSTFGTLSVRRRVTNMTGAPVTRLRFRVIIVTGYPVADSATADLRPISSQDIAVSVLDPAQCAPAAAPCDVTVRGTTLEEPPAQPNGGGINSSLGVGAVGLHSPLADGASVNVQFRLGIQKIGRFRFYVNVEALP